MRFWSSLVVKNGSKIRGSTSAGMPQPGVFHAHHALFADARRIPWKLPACRPWAWPPRRSPAAPEPPAGSGWRRSAPAADPSARFSFSSMFCMSSLCFTSSTARCTTVFKSFGSRWLGAWREKVSRFFTRSPQRLLSRSMVCSCSAMSSRAVELLLQQFAQHQPRIGQNAEQRIVDLVRHRGRQLPDGSHLLRAAAGSCGPAPVPPSCAAPALRSRLARRPLRRSFC